MPFYVSLPYVPYHTARPFVSAIALYSYHGTLGVHFYRATHLPRMTLAHLMLYRNDSEDIFNELSLTNRRSHRRRRAEGALLPGGCEKKTRAFYRGTRHALYTSRARLTCSLINHEHII